MKRTIILLTVVLWIFTLSFNVMAQETVHKHSTLSTDRMEEIIADAKEAESQFAPASYKYYTMLFFAKTMENPQKFGESMRYGITEVLSEGEPVSALVMAQFMYIMFNDAGLPEPANKINKKRVVAKQAAIKKHNRQKVEELLSGMKEFYTKYYDIPENKINR